MLKTVSNYINVIGSLIYQGTWDAATNTPTLTSGVGNKGDYYVVSVAGNTNLDGITDWQVNDYAVFNGSVWQKIDNTDAVLSVNGKTGVVVLTASDVGATPNTTYVSASGLLTGGGQLNANVTIGLNSVPVANVPGAVPNTVNIIAGSCLTGGGPLTGNVTISVSSIPLANITGLGTMATQNSNNVTITGGNITGTTIVQNATPLVAGMVYGFTNSQVYSPPVTLNGAWFAQPTVNSIYTDTGGSFNGTAGPQAVINAVNSGTISPGKILSLELYELSTSSYVYVNVGIILSAVVAGAGTNVTITFSNTTINWSLYQKTNPSFGGYLIVNQMLVDSGNAESVFLGYKAGNVVTTGGRNTLIGANVAPSVITGSNNIIVGAQADASGDVSNEATIGSVSITKTRLFGAVAFNNAYGNVGNILISQGNSAAPQWTSTANISIGTANIANSTVGTLSFGAGLSGSNFNGSANVTANLATTTVVAGSYGSASNVSSFTVDGYGRLTAASNVAIAIGVSAVSGAVPNTVNVIAGTGLSGGGALTGNVTLSATANSVNQKVTVQNNGVAVGSEPSINFVPGNNTTISASDDAGNTRSNVTISFNLNTTSSDATFATSSLPLVPEGYVSVVINGAVKKIPYYGV